MATYGWGSGTPVEEGLFDQSHRFEFYEAVRLLEQLHPETEPVGDGKTVDEEPVRFRGHADLSFPPSSVVDVSAVDGEDGPPTEMSVAFMSLIGTQGPLPSPYTELVQRRVSKGDTALRDFLDLLVHRLIALQYRSRRRHHVGMESRSPERSTVARYLRSIAGLGAEAVQDRLSVPDRALLRYADLFNQKPHSAHGLEVLLGDYFDLDVHAEPLTGHWVSLEDHQTSEIGPTGQNRALGTSTVLGARAWDQQGHLRMRVEAETIEDYLAFLPDGDRHQPFVELSELYLGKEVDVSLQLALPSEEVASTPASPLLGPRLGRSAWLGRPDAEVETDVRLRTFTPEQETLRVPMLASLTPGQLGNVLSELPRRTVPPGTHVVRQGQPAHAMFLWTEGAAEVRYTSPEAEESTVLTTLEPGRLFGDDAFFERETYPGSLVTLTQSVLFEITRDHLHDLRERYPALERGVEEAYPEAQSVGREDTPAQRSARETLVATTAPGVARLSGPQWHLLVGAGSQAAYTADEVVLRGRMTPDTLVVLLDGTVEGRDAGATIAETGRALNLRPLVDRTPHPQTLVATRSSAVLQIPRAALQRVLQKHAAIERALRIHYLRSDPPNA